MDRVVNALALFSGRLPRKYLLWLSVGLVAVCYGLAFKIGFMPPLLFALSVLLVFSSAPPVHLLSPRVLLTAFYLLWYTVPLMYATRYELYTFTEPETLRAYLMIVCTFLIGYVFLYYGERPQSLRAPRFLLGAPRTTLWLWVIAVVALVVMLTSCHFLVLSTGGLQRWLLNPGRAFLEREGAGVYSILLAFSSSTAAATIGAGCARSGRRWPVLAFAVIVLLISPLLGGKGRIFMTFVFLLLPWIFLARPSSRGAVAAGFLFLLSFTLVTYLRNHSWITPDQFFAYSLNYFNTFDLLVVSVTDFPPGWFETVLLPFNKFLVPFGTGDENFHYDMSAWLTWVYYPHIARLRATEQWPIETDLYLSFKYVYGLPLLALYFYVYGRVFELATRTRTLGAVFVSAFVTFSLAGHLRGGLLNWTDFYLIPFYLFSYFLLRGFTLPLAGASPTVVPRGSAATPVMALERGLARQSQ